MNKNIIENLKQFDDAADLLICVTEKYLDNINDFVRLNKENEIIKYKTPIIVDILPNKEIVFSRNSYLETIKVDPSIFNSEITAICQRSLFHFLKQYSSNNGTTLNMLFDELVDKDK